jgi:uncharacterized membrane protein
MGRKLAYAFCAVLIIGLLLRVHNLGKENLWSDEFYSLQTSAKESDAELIKKVDSYEINPPLYFLALRHWSQWFGKTEQGLRSLSLIFGMLNICLMYLAGKEWLGRKAGAIAAALMAISVVQVEFSQEARAYTMFMAFFMASLLVFIKILRKPAASHIWLIAIVNALGLLTHYLMIYMIFAESCIILLLKEKELIKKWAFALAGSFLIFLPWLPFFTAQMARWMVKWRGTLIGEYGLPEAIGNLGALAFSIPLIIGIALLALALSLFHLKGIELRKTAKIKIGGRNFELLFIAATAVIILAYLVLLPKMIVPFFLNKFTLPLTPFLYLFLAYGITRARRKTAALCLTAILMASAFGLLVYHTTERKEQIKQALQHVEEGAKPEEAILLCEGDLWQSIDYYTKLKNQRHYLYTPQNETERMRIFDAIEPQLGSGAWLVSTHCKKAIKGYLARMDRVYANAEKTEFKGVQVYHYAGLRV